MSELKDFVIENGVLTKYVGQGGDVVIPDGVKEIGERAFEFCDLLTAVTISAGLKKIGIRAFRACSNLKSLNILEGVEKIEEEAFADCYGLEEIHFPKTLNIIGRRAFKSCRSLTELSCPENLKAIGYAAFSNCSSLSKVILNEGLLMILDSAFCRCENITEVILPKSIIKLPSEEDFLPEEIFKRCYKLKKILAMSWSDFVVEKNNEDVIVDLRCRPITVLKNFKQKVLSIICFLENLEKGIEYDEDIVKENYTFVKKQRKKLYEHALKNISVMRYMISEKIIPLEDAMQISSKMDSSQNIEIKAMLMAYIDSFGNNAQEKVVEKQEKKIEKELFTDPNSEAGLKMAWNFKKNPDGTLTLNSLKQESEVVIVPEKIGNLRVTDLNDRCFKDKKNIKEVIIPNSVAKLGKKLFWGCSSLEKIIINADICKILEGPFECCSVKEIVLPVGLTSIGDSAFRGCDSLTSINIPNGITSIGDYAFYYCKSLTNIEIPDSVTSIGKRAFGKCLSLQYNIEGNLKYLGNKRNKYICLEGCESREIKNAIVNENCKIIGNYAFYGFPELTSIQLPNGITSIGDCAFNDCKSLTNIEIPDSVTSIGKRAFEKCLSLQYNIEGNLKYLGNKRNKYMYLEGCESGEIKNVIVNEKCKIIGIYAFDWFPTLTSIQLPNGITSIGDSAFRGCDSLTSINIPNSITSIGDYAFYYCKSLTNIEIPDSVISIGDSAFKGCDSLTSIEIPNSVTSIGDYAFYNYKSLTIRGKAGSFAEKYAKRNKIKFEAI